MTAYQGPSCARHMDNESQKGSVISSLQMLKLKVRILDIWPTKIPTPSCLFRATKFQCVLIMMILSRGPPILNTWG